MERKHAARLKQAFSVAENAWLQREEPNRRQG
jgi:hypothetical protein